MSVSCSMILILEVPDITGGTTESIFPRTEKMLTKITAYMKALKYVASRKKMDRYRSVVDFLFCELNPAWKSSCQKFYDEEGPQMKDLITERRAKEFDRMLVEALNLAHTLSVDRRRLKWAEYHMLVEAEYKH